MKKRYEIKVINLKQVKVLAAEGYTDKQLAKIFEVNPRTIDNWKKLYPTWYQSLKSGKLLADKKVEASLYQRACGYSHPDIHITNFQGKITKTPIIKHYAPDPTSMIFWLKNRKPDDWRDRHQMEHSGSIDIGLAGKIKKARARAKKCCKQKKEK